MQHFPFYDLLTFHNGEWDSEFGDEENIKEKNKAHAFAFKVLYRTGLHELAKKLSEKANTQVLYEGPGALFTTDLESRLDDRIRKITSKANLVCLNSKFGKYKLVGAELDLAAQIFQLPRIKAAKEETNEQIDGLIIDERLKEFAEWYLPGMAVYGRKPQRKIEEQQLVLPRFHLYTDGLPRRVRNNFVFIPINYGNMGHSNIIETAKKNGIFQDFLEYKNISAELYGLTRNDYVCVSLRSNRYSAYRMNNWTYLIEKMRLLIGSKTVVNLTPNINLEEIDKLNSIFDIKIVQPKVDLWDDIYGVAAIMSGAATNITIMNNLMEIGGAAGAKTYVVDPHKRLSVWEDKNNGSYYFWDTVNTIR